MHLVPVLGVRLLAVVAHGHRQEMEHQVRVGHILVGADEPAALEVVRGSRALASQQPLQADERIAPQVQVGLHGHRLGAGVLDVDLQVVLQVLADAGKVDHGVDSEGVEVPGFAYAGELQQLRGGVDGAAGQDDLAGVDHMGLAVAAVGDAGGHRALEVDFGDHRPGEDCEVRTAGVGGADVCPGCREALALVDVSVEGREAFLAVAVDVVGQGVADFLGCLEEGLEERVGGRATFQDERAVVAAQFVIRVRCQRVFHLVEVGQAVREIPGIHAGVGAPALVIEGGLPRWKIMPLMELEPPRTLPRACATRRPPMKGSGSDS